VLPEAWLPAQLGSRQAVSRQYQDQISRRDLQALTETVRRELAQQRQAELRHITWQIPGLV
jgi:hypothetical protein